MASPPYKIPVSFAFVTAPKTQVCTTSRTCSTRGRSDNVSATACRPTVEGKSDDAADGPVSRHPVVVKHVDHRTLTAETRVFFCSAVDTMNTIYELVVSGKDGEEEVVCFTPATCTHISPGFGGRGADGRVLLRGEPIPPFLFCQTVVMPPSSPRPDHFVCAHFLVFTVSGALRTARLPCLVPVTASPGPDAITFALAAQLGATPAEVAYLRSCPLVLCGLSDGCLTIVGDANNDCDFTPRRRGTGLHHVALLLPLMSPGDIVRIDARIRNTSPVTVQGIVSRTTISSDGVHYDVLEMDSYVEVAGQTCTRVIPL